MKKYWSIFKIVVSNTIIYRFDLFYDTIQSFIVPLLMLAALSSAKSDSVNPGALVPYFLIVAILGPVIRPKIHEDFYQLTHTGEVAKFVSKPISLYNLFLATWSSRNFINLLALLPPILIIMINLSYPSLLLFSPLILILSFLLYFNLSFLCGLVAFWVDEFWAISNAFEVSLTILCGVILPYQFFPSWFSRIIRYTPFPYTANWLARSTSDGLHISEVIISATWILATYICCRALEAKAIKYHSLVGG